MTNYQISIHSPRMGRDDPSGSIPSYGDLISIHSPRMGRDPGRSRSPRMISRFQSTLPAWGETAARRWTGRGMPFQSTLPAWGETNKDDTLLLRRAISIHSPRMGRDSGSPSGPARHEDFNPLSPHGERLDYACMAEKWEPFQSTLPAWGETPLSR